MLTGWTKAEKESLIAARVLAVERQRQLESRSGTNIRERQRAHAADAVSSIGSVTRFLGSTLLLLAVVGTFAGMKTALPQLMNALSETAGARLSPETLRPVSDAFGANFLALVGALAMGFASFGALQDRRQLISALEKVTEPLYRTLPVGPDLGRLDIAIAEVSRSAERVADVAEGVGQLRTVLGSLEFAFVGAIDSLNVALQDSWQRQVLSLQGRLDETLHGVTESVAAVAKMLGSTAVAYEGVVSGLVERDLGVQSAAREFGKAAARLEASVERLGAKASAILESVGNATRSTERSSQTMADASARISTEIERFNVEMRSTAAGRVQMIGAIQSMNESIQLSLEKHGAGVSTQLDALGGDVRQSVAASSLEAARRIDAARTVLVELRAEIGSVANDIITSLGAIRGTIPTTLEKHAETVAARVDSLGDSVREVATAASAEAARMARDTGLALADLGLDVKKIAESTGASRDAERAALGRIENAVVAGVKGLEAARLAEMSSGLEQLKKVADSSLGLSGSIAHTADGIKAAVDENGAEVRTAVEGIADELKLVRQSLDAIGSRPDTSTSHDGSGVRTGSSDPDGQEKRWRLFRRGQ